MEWLLGLAAVFGFFWWLGQGTSGPAGPVAKEVVRRATDMNDPDGTFMDGYVAGRLTERYEAPESVEQRQPRSDGLNSEEAGLDDVSGDYCAYDWGRDEDIHDDAHDDDW